MGKAITALLSLWLVLLKGELEITAQDNLLVEIAHADNKERTYLYRGIAERNFERKFQLAENIHVRGANLVNGLLYIDLERIPEAKEQQKHRNQLSQAAWRGLTSPCSPSGAYANLRICRYLSLAEDDA